MPDFVIRRNGPPTAERLRELKVRALADDARGVVIHTALPIVSIKGGRGRYTRVQLECVATGEYWRSLTAAERDLGFAKQTILRAVVERRPLGGRLIRVAVGTG